jgi:hypothetical protein
MTKRCPLLAITLASLCVVAYAQSATAPYNEAVHMVNGKRVVDVAPFPKHMDYMVSTFHRPDEHPGLMNYVNVVETSTGPMDCLGTWWYHPKACSPSTFGQKKFPRQWTVEMHGAWYGCIGREKPIACMPLVPDGKLHALPTPLEE